MGNTVFLIFLAIFVALLLYASFNHEKNRKNRRLERLMEGFGDRNFIADEKLDDHVPALFPYLCETRKGYTILDDITVSDLKLFELYKRMNRCVTSAGDDILWCKLRMMPDENNSGTEFFDAVKSIVSDPQKARDIIKVLMHVGKPKDEDAFESVKSLVDAKEKSIVSDLIPLTALILSIALTAFFPPAGIILTVLMIIVCIYLYFVGKRGMDENLCGLSFSLKMITCANRLCDMGFSEFEEYRSLSNLKRGSFLISFKDALVSDPLSILFDYVRMITHIDLIAYKIKLYRIQKYTDELLGLYTDIGSVDAKVSVASYIAGRKYCKGIITDDFEFSAKGMYHPLVRKPVGNDIDAKRGMILTGSNASGKSTFLKACGINLLFARSFGFAFADAFSSAPFSLYTSMALSDDLLKRESYYVVEARSIKRMTDAAASGMCLCIIDEVLRGTNTIERIAAAKCILSSLILPGVLCFAATHDLELAMLLDEDYDCYYFTEEMSGDNVTFPYLIKEGISSTTNAIKLLGVLGFDKKIVDDANETVERFKKTGKWEKIK